MFDPLRPEPPRPLDMDFRPPGPVGQIYTGCPQNAGTILQGRWEILGPLGQGGMGTVYKACDRRLSNRLCVVKKLRVDVFREEEREQALQFFEREATMLSNLKHPNIVRIYDCFRELENYYLVMEYVDGENLERMLIDQGEPFSEAKVTNWAITICEVLHYLHSCRPPVIYRDLKPSNIMIDAVDGIKLVDFGIARPYREDSNNTHVVSAGYSPPEQYWGGADPRSDIYALGATMNFLLTGMEPLPLQTSVPKKINPRLSDKIDRIIQKATAQYVEMRYQYVCAMREDLEEAIKPQRLQLSSKAIIALCAIALIPLVAFALSFASNFTHNMASLVSKAPPANERGEIENGGSLSQSQTSKDDWVSIDPDRPKVVAEPTVASVASLLELKGAAGEQKPRFYPLDMAASESSEELLTDPEALPATDDTKDSTSPVLENR